MTGVIKQIQEKRFGFIKVKGQEKDVFFHVSGLNPNLQWEDLKVGLRVTFDIESTAKGNKAVDVRPA